ncbi:hypothetical protein ABAC460_00890 [Asticcacaulis sp. AC460]|uniref:GH92 family glycosyl hydrolase n=1 Tax=Asticcacaulis sp. AC460 TaxID=1282360 RepID=UPI0003C3AE5A|nr:GH92 family glycosyl hydrolase [Asticcacaulis sp. AC460]ESQ93289.1 hypothetical protein ABAC460_00890 [Asticcacaulis sp. AC460]
MKIWTAALFALALVTPAVADTPVEIADPFFGSEGGGNTVPGAAVPFGFVNFSPDTTQGDTNGYDGWSPVTGFAYTHVSGTGGNSKYGNFRVTPTTGPVNPRNLAYQRHDEQASPGLYTVLLGNRPEDQIKVELTATRMSGFQKLTFPKDRQGNILIDVTSSVQLMGGGPHATGGHVEVNDDGSISGWASFRGGWNANPYKLYFHAVVDRKPAAVGIWTASQGQSALFPGVGVKDGGDQDKDRSQRLGAYLSFDTASDTDVQMKLAVSFVSIEKAKYNLDEAPGWNFELIHHSARAAWASAMAKIEVTGGTDAQREVFYSALYRSHSMPHDVSGDNVWWSSDEPHYEDYYAIWDTFRTMHPLMTLIQPDRQRGMVRSLLDTYKHTGWLPDARTAGGNGLTQGGSNGDVLLADAIVKDLGGFDVNLAYEAIKKDAEVESPDPMNVGRVLADYDRLGYMPLSEARSGSRTVEYAYNDYVAGVVAQKLGHKADAAKYLKRAGNWRNLWDSDLQCIRPRYADGAWLENYRCDYTYPDKTAGWWDHPFYEGSGWQYSTYVPHDVKGLIEVNGGEAGFVAWLDRFFDGHHYDQGNEPDILASFLYIHAGRPDRTAERVRAIMSGRYKTGTRGLPGNDDSGAMSSWYVWNAIGLYPNAGQPFYYIGSPVFESAAIQLEGGKTFTVVAKGTSATNLYVVGAKLNGKPIDRAWLTHKEIVKGGTLELEMADEPGAWATKFAAP